MLVGKDDASSFIHDEPTGRVGSKLRLAKSAWNLSFYIYKNILKAQVSE